MDKTFEELVKLFNTNKFDKIEKDTQGIRFLKLRSISRKDTITEIANQNNLSIDKKKSDDIFKMVFEDSSITETLIDNYILEKYTIERDERKNNNDGAKEFISNLNNLKKEIINESIKNPNELKVWLYENQGEMRFDASNRFFLILVNETDLSQSWKLKRNIKFLREHINYHLDTLEDDLDRLKTKFYWKKDNETYHCKSDILFIKFRENN